MDILQWYNLIFILPFTGALLYVLSLGFGLGSDGHELGGEAHLDSDFEHDLGVEHAIEVGHGHDHEAEAHHEPSFLFRALSILGFGKVPLSLIVVSFCFLWGFSGWASNQIAGGMLRWPVIFVWPSLGVAVLVSFFGTRFMARGLARVMPSTESYGESYRDLEGKVGEAVYDISSEFGRTQVKDKYGNLHEVPCHTAPGTGVIKSGSRVVLMSYDRDSQVFTVRLDPLASSGLLTK